LAPSKKQTAGKVADQPKKDEKKKIVVKAQAKPAKEAPKKAEKPAI